MACVYTNEENGSVLGQGPESHSGWEVWLDDTIRQKSPEATATYLTLGISRLGLDK